MDNFDALGYALAAMYAGAEHIGRLDLAGKGKEVEAAYAICDYAAAQADMLGEVDDFLRALAGYAEIVIALDFATDPVAF